MRKITKMQHVEKQTNKPDEAEDRRMVDCCWIFEQ